MNTKLYVGNVPFSSTAQDLQDLFGQVGTVSAVDMMSDKFTGRSRGFAFVTMATPSDAQNAIEKLHGYTYEGRPLSVNEARPKEDRPPRQFDGGDGGEGRGERGERRNRDDFR